MRTFVIQSPGLSVGRPGATVTAVQLRMSDDKLDAFVEAGYAIEIHGPTQSDPPDDDIPDTPLDELDIDVVRDSTHEPAQLPDLGDSEPARASVKKAAKKP